MSTSEKEPFNTHGLYWRHYFKTSVNIFPFKAHSFTKLRLFLQSSRPTFFQRCSFNPLVPITLPQESYLVCPVIVIISCTVFWIKKSSVASSFPEGGTFTVTNIQVRVKDVSFRTYWFPCVVHKDKELLMYTR